jgi:hypothetical protein
LFQTEVVEEIKKKHLLIS